MPSRNSGQELMRQRPVEERYQEEEWIVQGVQTSRDTTLRAATGCLPPKPPQIVEPVRFAVGAAINWSRNETIARNYPRHVTECQHNSNSDEGNKRDRCGFETAVSMAAIRSLSSLLGWGGDAGGGINSLRLQKVLRLGYMPSESICRAPRTLIDVSSLVNSSEARIVAQKAHC
jgi:hypothetical protein